MTDMALEDPGRRPDHGGPLVSIVIPHFNRADRLVATLRSLEAQTFADWEAIIVDDASPEDPFPVLAPFLEDDRFRLVRLPQNEGPSVARNTGIEQSKGRFVAFLDSDDLWNAEKLAAQLSVILQAPDPDRIICTTQILKLGPGDARETGPARQAQPGEDFGRYVIVTGGLTQTSSILLTRRTALQIGFEPTLRQFEDYLFFIRAGALGLEHRLAPEPLVTWFNDDRPNRLSKSLHNNVDNLNRFLTLAGPLMNSETKLCFLTRHAGIVHVRSAPVRGLFDLARAIAAGLISWRFAASIIANGLAPRWLIRLRKQSRRRPEKPPDLAEPSLH